MIRAFFIVVCAVFLLPSSSFAQIDTTSYCIGISVGDNLKRQGATSLDYASFAQAIQDVLESKDLMVSKPFSDSLNYAYFQSQRDKMYTKVKDEGTTFLSKNGLRPEVTTTASGLQYEVLIAASGEKPKASNTVTIHYVGTLLNGDMFDSSVDKGKPLTYPLNKFIAGWTEGLQLMSTGSKYRFYIPEHLAYGSRGAGASIPPYSALIFDVELLSWK